MLRLVGEVPEGVTAVVVKYRGERQTVPVTDGCFQWAAWDVAATDETIPEVAAYVRRDG